MSKIHKARDIKIERFQAAVFTVEISSKIKVRIKLNEAHLYTYNV